MKYLTILIFIVLSVVYYFTSFGSDDYSQVFLTISTFLFAIFTGFFISRQGQRYSAIREQITKFDGEMSSIYRKFGHLGKEAQESAKEIIHDHYEKILTHKKWDYHFINPSNTITDCHQLLESVAKDKSLPSLQNFAVQRILVSLESVQVARKGMVALHQERIPRFQWVLVYFLVAILLVAVSTIPSEGFLIGSILKGAFSSSALFVVILLNSFDRLHFFEGTIGENSARDILDIFAGKK
ncbi:MAG: hypothetical protein ACNFW9_00710 [Candidatus Kerfeldbacteria bacterium]